jgi:hypothetical protein
MFSSSPEKRHRVGHVIGRLKSHRTHTFHRPRGRTDSVLTCAGGRLMQRTSGPDIATNGLRQPHLTRLLRCGSRLPHHVKVRCDQLAEHLSGMAEFVKGFGRLRTKASSAGTRGPHALVYG